MSISPQPNLNDTFMKVAKFGDYYFPASRHYNDPSVVVGCDRCRKPNLSACISLDEYDLCLSCVDKLVDQPGFVQVVPPNPPIVIPFPCPMPPPPMGRFNGPSPTDELMMNPHFPPLRPSTPPEFK